jgi:hypothetical protein
MGYKGVGAREETDPVRYTIRGPEQMPSGTTPAPDQVTFQHIKKKSVGYYENLCKIQVVSTEERYPKGILPRVRRDVVGLLLLC